MKYKIILLLFLFVVVQVSPTNAQSCPTNIDFESGLGTWNYFRGTVAVGPVYTLASTPPVPGLHTLTGGAGTDSYGGFPVVAPGGGFHSLKLGHDSTNYSAERATYFIHVPSTGTFSLIYKYAVVLNDGGHPPPYQARFVVSASDSTTGVALPCIAYEYVVSSSLPGFLGSSTPGILYKPWTTGNMKFAGYGGHTIKLDVTAADCGYGGHWGYGYFDMSCGIFANTTVACGDTTTLTAPDGYAAYHWWDSATFTTSYGTSQTISIASPTITTTYAVILTPFTGYGCTDTLYTEVIPSSLSLHPSHDTTICAGSSVTLTSGATGTALPFTYSWSPATGLSCTSCASPVASPTLTTTYHVSVSDTLGCSRSDSIRITVIPSPGPITGPDSVCAGSDTLLSDAVPGGIWTSSGTSIATIDSFSGMITGISPGTVTITYTTGGLCTATTTVTVNPKTACTLGVTALSKTGMLKVYPNPNEGNFTLLLSTAFDEPAEVTITNMMGEKVAAYTGRTNKNNPITLPVPPGIYTLFAATVHGRYIEKVMLMK